MTDRDEGADRDPEIERVKAVLHARLGGAAPRSSQIGRFIVQGRVGSGGMGIVYSAIDPLLERPVAIKVLFDLASDERHRARLLGEAKALAKLSHPNVVGVYEVGEHHGRTFVAMEYVRGRTLRHWLGEARRDWRATLQMCIQAGRGLAAAHDHGIVHRDFKPDNVLVGNDERARVADFGLARNARLDSFEEGPLDADAPGVSALASRLTFTGAVLGTPAYMSPEQMRGEDVDPRADQFAFCVATWEALAGERPFSADNLHDLMEKVNSGDPSGTSRGGIPREVAALLRRGLLPQPERRHASMAALLDALERNARARHTRALVLVGVGSLLVLAAWGGLEGWRRRSREQIVASCNAAGDRIADAWTDDMRRHAHERLAGAGMAYQKLTDTIAAYVDSWRVARTEACLDHAGRSWTDDVFERARFCLDERRVELEALTGEVVQGDVNVAHRYAATASGLTSVDDCRDLGMLARLPAPPVESRDEILEAHAGVARARAVAHAGQHERARDLALTARVRAERVAWPGLTSRARVVELTASFGPRSRSDALSSEGSDNSVWLAPDELTAYVGSNRPGGVGGHDIFTASRDAVDAPFGALVALAGVGTTEDETRPTLTADGLTLYCTSTIHGSLDIMVSSRASLAAPFASLVAIPELNTAVSEGDPWIDPQGRTLYFWSDRHGTPDLFAADRRPDGSFDPPHQLAELNTAEFGESDATLSGDALTIVFASDRLGSLGWADVWLAKRATTREPFGLPERVAAASSSQNDFPVWLSADGRRLYFVVGGEGEDIWVSRRAE